MKSINVLKVWNQVLKKNNAITVHIYYTGENGSAKAFVKEMLTSGLVDEIRKEKGNRRYEYFFSVEDEETVLLVDSWDNQEAIDLHHASSIMDKITELRIKYHLHIKVERYFLNETEVPKVYSKIRAYWENRSFRLLIFYLLTVWKKATKKAFFCCKNTVY